MGDAHADVWDRLDQAPDSTLVAFFTDFEHIFQEGTSFIESDLLSETPSSSCQSLDRPARINGGEGLSFIEVSSPAVESSPSLSPQSSPSGCPCPSSPVSPPQPIATPPEQPAVLIASPTAVPSPQAEEKSTSTSSATSGGSPPDSPNSAQTSEEQRKIFAEMLELIDWPKPGSIQKGKRALPSSNRREKHTQMEKKRRSDANMAIDRLRALMPPLPEEKPTKIDVLNEATEYLRRVQELTLALLEENKRLKQRFAESHNSSAPSAGSSPSQLAPTTVTVSPSSSLRENFRMLMVTVFLIWTAFGLPFGIPSSPVPLFDTGRVLLEHTFTTASVMPFVPLWVTKVILLFAALSLLVALFSLQDTALDSRSERFCAAVEQYRAGLQCLSRGKPQKAVQHYHNTLRLLGKRIPESVPMQIVHLLVHCMRIIMAVLRVGVWIERKIAWLLSRDQSSFTLETATYVRMLELYGSWKMEKDTLTFFCLVVSATSSLIRYREHASMKHSLGVLSSFPPIGGSNWAAKLTHWLVRFVLPKLGIEMMEDGIKLFGLYMLGREYLSEGRFEAAREQWRLALQTVRIPWYGKRRILLTAANSYILEGRYREAAVLCSEALRSGLLNDDEEVVITAALQIVHALCRLGEASAAALLFSQVENYMELVGADSSRTNEYLGFLIESAHVSAELKEYDKAIENLQELFEYIRTKGVPKGFFLLSEILLVGSLVHELWEKAKAGNEEHLRGKLKLLKTLSGQICKALSLLSILHPFVAAASYRCTAWKYFLLSKPRLAADYLNKAILFSRERKLHEEEAQALALQNNHHALDAQLLYL